MLSIGSKRVRSDVRFGQGLAQFFQPFRSITERSTEVRCLRAANMLLATKIESISQVCLESELGCVGSNALENFHMIAFTLGSFA